MFNVFDALVTSVYVLGIVLVWMVIVVLICGMARMIKGDDDTLKIYNEHLETELVKACQLNEEMYETIEKMKGELEEALRDVEVARQKGYDFDV